MDYPKLRNLDIFPLENAGQKVIGLRDPLDMSDKVVVISYQDFFIVSLFDGKHSLLDIKAEYMRKHGEMLFTEQLEGIITQLDENYLLDSERYENYRLQREAEAEAALRSALDLEPNNLEYLYALADYYGKRKRFDEALAMAERMIVAQPSNRTAHELKSLFERLLASPRQH